MKNDTQAVKMFVVDEPCAGDRRARAPACGLRITEIERLVLREGTIKCHVEKAALPGSKYPRDACKRR